MTHAFHVIEPTKLLRIVGLAGTDQRALGEWAADKIERAEDLLNAIDAFSKAVSQPGGPSLAVQRHDPSWEAWKKLCDEMGRFRSS